MYKYTPGTELLSPQLSTWSSLWEVDTLEGEPLQTPLDYTHTHTQSLQGAHTASLWESKTLEAWSWWSAGQHLFTVQDTASNFQNHQSSLAAMKLHISAFEGQETYWKNHASKQSSVSLNILKPGLLTLYRSGKSFEHIDLSSFLPRGGADCWPFQPLQWSANSDRRAAVVKPTWLQRGCQVSLDLHKALGHLTASL